MNYTLKRSKRKTLAIEVRSNAEVIVRAPLFTPDFYIKQFVKSHKSWIDSKLSDIDNTPHYSYVFKPETGHSIYFLGEKYQIQRVESSNQHYHLNESSLIIGAKTDDIAMNQLLKFYKSQAKDYLPNRLSEISSQVNLPFQKVRITSAKTRWGSCSYQNNINLSYRLMMLPNWVIDYVIIHELVHTEIKDHSKRFWFKVSELCPHTQSAKAWINTHRKDFPI